MPYEAITLSAARTELANRLADSSMVRWTSDELDRLILEAIRTWNAFTATLRERGVFTLTTQDAWYDLGTQLSTLCPRTQTNYDVIRTMQDFLLEPVNPASWTGTAQFTLQNLTDAIEHRRDQFLKETGAVLTRIQPTINPPPSGRIPLPTNTLGVRRGMWRSSSGLISPLRRDDEWGADHYLPNWPQQPRRPPAAYSVAVTPPLQLQLLPAPLDTGQLDGLIVQQGSGVTVGTEAALGIPNDWIWVIKYGALADVLGTDGLSFDPIRASYCEARWEQGLDLAKRASVVLSARINDVPCRISSVSDADAYSPLWQTVPGIPRTIVTAGHNLVASWPPPGVAIQGGTWSVGLDVVRTMPSPANSAAYLDISADAIDPVLDYAQHVAIAKEGPAQLQTSQPLLDRFLRFCGVTLNWQQAQQPARGPLMGQQTQDQRALPDRAPAVEAMA